VQLKKLPLRALAGLIGIAAGLQTAGLNNQSQVNMVSGLAFLRGRQSNCAKIGGRSIELFKGGACALRRQNDFEREPLR